jgi:hypothetical protein
MRRFAVLLTAVAAAAALVQAQGARRVSILITHGTVITVDAQRRVIDAGAGACDGTGIADVGRAAYLAAG